MKTHNGLSAIQEDYLAVIHQCDVSGDGVRPGDVARELGLHKSTVTAGLKALAAKGLVVYQPYRPVRLTATGRRIGESVLFRFDQTKRLLAAGLKCGDREAEALAGVLGHAVTPELAERLFGK